MRALQEGAYGEGYVRSRGRASFFVPLLLCVNPLRGGEICGQQDSAWERGEGELVFFSVGGVFGGYIWMSVNLIMTGKITRAMCTGGRFFCLFLLTADRLTV